MVAVRRSLSDSTNQVEGLAQEVEEPAVGRAVLEQAVLEQAVLEQVVAE
jgi:hypothetical protein